MMLDVSTIFRFFKAFYFNVKRIIQRLYNLFPSELLSIHNVIQAFDFSFRNSKFIVEHTL